VGRFRGAYGEDDLLATYLLSPGTHMLGTQQVGFIVFNVFVTRFTVNGSKVGDQCNRFIGLPGNRLAYITDYLLDAWF